MCRGWVGKYRIIYFGILLQTFLLGPYNEYVTRKALISNLITINFIIQLAFLIYRGHVLSDFTHLRFGRSVDLIQYISAAKIAKQYGVDQIYNLKLQEKIQHDLVKNFPENKVLAFRALPVTALLFISLVNLPPVAAFFTVFAIKFILLFASLYIVYKLFNLKPIPFFVLVSFLPFTFLPLNQDFLMGQLTIPVLFFTVASLFLLQKNMQVSAGFLSALVLIKPQYILLLVLLFIIGWYEKKSKYCVSLVVGVITFLLLNVFLYGPKLFSVYFKYVVVTESPRYGTLTEVNYNFSAVLSWLGVSGVAKPALVVALLVLFMLTALYILKNPKHRFPKLIFLIGTLPFFMIHTMPYDPVLLLLPMFFSLTYLLKLKKFVYLSESLWLLIPWLGLFVLQPICVLVVVAVNYCFLQQINKGS